MAYYIVATEQDDKMEFNPLVGAPNPRRAVIESGVDPDRFDEVHIYPIKENENNEPQYYTKDDLKTEFNPDDDRVAVGDCPECGYIIGDEVNLPACTCDNCGSELNNVTIADREEVEKRQ